MYAIRAIARVVVLCAAIDGRWRTRGLTARSDECIRATSSSIRSSRHHTVQWSIGSFLRRNQNRLERTIERTTQPQVRTVRSHVRSSPRTSLALRTPGRARGGNEGRSQALHPFPDTTATLCMVAPPHHATRVRCRQAVRFTVSVCTGGVLHLVLSMGRHPFQN